jgi:hypothetical protein
MTCRVNAVQTVAVPVGVPLTTVAADGDITIWPQGVGTGPTLTMTQEDWRRVKNSVDAALQASRNQR